MAGNLPTLSLDFTSTYHLDQSQVNYILARDLYYNTNVEYKLGAGFARPAINVPAGYMGIPYLKLEDPTSDSQKKLSTAVKTWSGDIVRAHKMTLRDGEVVIRLRPKNRAPAYQKLYGPDDKELELALVPTEGFEIISKDEDLDAIEAIKFKHLYLKHDPFTDQLREVVLWETVYADQIILKYEDEEMPDRTLPNPLGFVPAVHFQNEPEIHQLHAASELEPVEPYLKFYNDVMLHAGTASALHSTAKLTIRTRDVERFLTNNFSDSEIADGRLRFRNKDVLFFESGDPAINVSGSAMYSEGAEIIQAEAPLGDTNTLLEYIFLNIVDVTEVPEWAFGGAVASSKASVTEQSAPLIHKVGRKRGMVENLWALVGRMYLKAALNESAQVSTTWDTLAMRDLKTEGEAFRNFAESTIALNDAGMISKITVNEILREIIPEILPYDVDSEGKEADRISAEVAEKTAAAEEQMRTMQEQLEDEDRETGLRVVGGSGGPNTE